MGQSKRKTYTVSQIARVCGVTVASVSKYIKRHSLKPIDTGKNNSKYFDEAVLSEIRSYYKDKSEKQATSDNYRPATKDDIISELRSRIDELTATNELLRQELDVKNKQIDSAIRLADQAQQLDLTHQQKVLPEKEVKSTVEEPSEKKKSFWSFLKG